MKKYYAGIGSRLTPKEVMDEMTWIAGRLERKGYVLRSGGAPGADMAFEAGVSDPANKEIYLPWPGFERNKSKLSSQSSEAARIAKKFHPSWDKLSQGTRKMMARNSHQVMGGDMSTPVDFVLCWTPEGKPVGGTSQAIRIAKFYKINVINMFDEFWYENLMETIHGGRKQAANKDIELPEEPSTLLLL